MASRRNLELNRRGVSGRGVVISGLTAIIAAAVVLGILIVHDRSRRDSGSGVPVLAGWIALACGIAGALALLVPMVGSWLAVAGVDKLAPWLLPASISLGLVSLAAGVHAVVRGDRGWRAWSGLVAGGLVTGFWLLFLLGEVLTPH